MLCANRQRRMPRLAFLRVPLLFALLSSASAWLAVLAPTDGTRYQCYALTFWFGSRAGAWLPAAQCAFLVNGEPQPALRLLPLEYPPLALLPFSLPLLVPLPLYAPTFALVMVVAAGCICWLLVQFHSPKAAARFLVLLVLGAGALFPVRYDLLPAGCMLVCLLAAERGRWRLAYGALALGVLLKLYPLVALPVLVLAEQRSEQGSEQDNALAPLHQHHRWLGSSWLWRWRHLALFGGIVLGVMGGFALLNPRAAVIGPLNYWLERPAQIESLQSSLLWLAHLAGMPAQVVLSYGSLNVLSPLASVVGWAGSGLGALGSGCVYWLQWRARLALGQALLALLCVVIITGKVFSPQYLIWLFPLIVSVEPRRRWLVCWGAIGLLTMGIYVGYYSQLPNPATAAQTIQTLPGFFVLVGFRNGAVLVVTVASLFDWLHIRKKTTNSAPDTLTPGSRSATLRSILKNFAATRRRKEAQWPNQRP